MFSLFRKKIIHETERGFVLICPVCKSTNIEVGRMVYEDGEVIVQDAKCSDCGFIGSDRRKL